METKIGKSIFVLRTFISNNKCLYLLPIGNLTETSTMQLKALQQIGPVNTRCTVTGEKTLRTMTLWSSQELLDANVDKIRALATSASGMSPTSGMTGPLAVELN